MRVEELLLAANHLASYEGMFTTVVNSFDNATCVDIKFATVKNHYSINANELEPAYLQLYVNNKWVLKGELTFETWHSILIEIVAREVEAVKPKSILPNIDSIRNSNSRMPVIKAVGKPLDYEGMGQIEMKNG